MPAADEPLEAPVREYDLYCRLGTGFILRLRDKGVRPEADGLAFIQAGRWERRPFHDVTMVHISSGSVPSHGIVGQCRIHFRDGTSLLVSSASASGRPDPAKRQVYAAFIRDLHGRLVASGAAKRIEFREGFSQARYTVLLVSAGLASVLFLALPLVLFIAVQEVKLLFGMIFGVMFLLPTWQVAQKNRPGRYDPHAPPDHLGD